MKARGFSVIELVMVIVIMGILTTAVAVLWPEENYVDEQLERLASDIRFAQHKAQTQNIRTRVNFSAGSYSVTLANGTTAVNLPTQNSNVVTLFSGVSLSTTNIPNNYIVFDALGRPYTNNATPGTRLTTTATVTLTQGSNSGSIQILPNTGRIP